MTVTSLTCFGMPFSLEGMSIFKCGGIVFTRVGIPEPRSRRAIGPPLFFLENPQGISGGYNRFYMIVLYISGFGIAARYPVTLLLRLAVIRCECAHGVAAGGLRSSGRRHRNAMYCKFGEPIPYIPQIHFLQAEAPLGRALISDGPAFFFPLVVQNRSAGYVLSYIGEERPWVSRLLHALIFRLPECGIFPRDVQNAICSNL